MKAIKELNAKRYWRLLKVIYAFFVTLVCIASFLWLYESFQTYNPKDIEKIKDRIQREDTYYQSIRSSVEKLNGDYSSGSMLTLSSTRWSVTLDKNILLYIFSFIEIEYPYSIEWVWRVCDYWECDTSYINDNSYNKYIKEWIVVSIPYNQIKDFKSSYEYFYNTIKYNLNDYKDSWYWYSLISSYNEYYSDNISTNQDHIWIIEILKILFSMIGVICWIIIITYILKRTVYYIVLWNFFIES